MAAFSRLMAITRESHFIQYMNRSYAALALLILAPIPANAQAVPQWHLEQLASVRPAEGSAGTLGDVQGMAIFADGSVAVAELNPSRVSRYGRDGKFIQTLMRAGEGPAETRRPKIAAQGDTLVVYDGPLSRLTRITKDGRLLDERLISAAFDGTVWTADDGTIILQITETPRPWTGGGMRIHPNGRIDTVYWRHTAKEELTILWNGPSWGLRGRTPFAPTGATTFDRAGRLVIGGSRHSRWAVVSGQDTMRIVALPDHPVPIAKQVRDSVWTVWYAQLDPKKLPHLAEVVREDLIPTTLPPWVSFNIDPRGAWWIGRPGPDGVLAAWDVVIDGKMAGHIARPDRITEVFPMGPVMAFGKGVVALLHEDADGVPWIGVYRVVMGR
jgi:hypothetical protein